METYKNYYLSILLYILSLIILLSYYFIVYKPENEIKQSLITTSYIIENQSIIYNNNCNILPKLQCNCNIYQSFIYLLNIKTKSYCCDEKCLDNYNNNYNDIDNNNYNDIDNEMNLSLKIIVCNNYNIILNKIKNLNNIINDINITCYYDKNLENCINKWILLYEYEYFECYYYSNNPETIILTYPNFTDIILGFIFFYIFLGLSSFSFIIGIIYILKNYPINNNYIII